MIAGGCVDSMVMFREAIVRRLNELDWTQYRLAQESGVGKTAIYDYLSGHREISSSNLERICRTLGLRLEKVSDIA